MAQDNTHYEAVIADLEAKRDQLTSMIETLKMMASVGMPLTGLGGMSSVNAIASPAEVIRPDSFFGMTIPDAARKYLSIVKQTKPHPELCDALLAGGFKTSAGNFREVVRATLGRNGDFVKINGQWGLGEWYGNRGKRRTKRRSSSEDETDSSYSSSDSSSEDSSSEDS